MMVKQHCHKYCQSYSVLERSSSHTTRMSHWDISPLEACKESSTAQWVRQHQPSSWCHYCKGKTGIPIIPSTKEGHLGYLDSTIGGGTSNCQKYHQKQIWRQNWEAENKCITTHQVKYVLECQSQSQALMVFNVPDDTGTQIKIWGKKPV